LKPQINIIHKTFWIITLIVFIILLVPSLVQDGMFLDGVTYSAISKNLANNNGTIWKPFYTKTLYPEFFEHPPLFFFIQSIFFKILGNSLYVERLFSLITAIISLLGIKLIWELFFNKSNLKYYSWMPVFLWIITPIIFWSYKNNMLENLLTVFILFSVIFSLKALIQNKIFYLLLSGLFILFAFLTKGFVGLFPLVIIIIYWITINKISFSKTILYTGILLLFPIEPKSLNNITQYFNIQLIPSIKNNRELADYRFYILVRLLNELIPIVIITLVITLINKFHNILKRKIEFKNILFFILIAFSASIPLLITQKQNGYYLVPSIPFFSISFSILIVQYLQDYFANIESKRFIIIKKFFILLFFFTIIFSFSFIGKYSRDKEMLKDIYSISNQIPQGTVISVPQKLCYDWTLIAYFSRINNISLDCSSKQKYYLIKKDFVPEELITKEYKEIKNIKLTKFKIYKQNQN